VGIILEWHRLLHLRSRTLERCRKEAADSAPGGLPGGEGVKSLRGLLGKRDENVAYSKMTPGSNFPHSSWTCTLVCYTSLPWCFHSLQRRHFTSIILITQLWRVAGPKLCSMLASWSPSLCAHSQTSCSHCLMLLAVAPCLSLSLCVPEPVLCHSKGLPSGSQVSVSQ
jgi:hypothetical protein